MKDMKKNGFQTLLDELCEMRISQGLSKKVEPRSSLLHGFMVICFFRPVRSLISPILFSAAGV